MNGPVAQIVALTCHANAALAGLAMQKFFPDNSTCQFCNAVTFVVPKKNIFGRSNEVVVAASPDDWFSALRARSALGVRLDLGRNLRPEISDRMTAGFVGGGGLWNMNVARADGTIEMWVARWEVSDRDAPNRKIWRVTYGQVGSFKEDTQPTPNLTDSTAQLREALRQIQTFAERHVRGAGFAAAFKKAGDCLDDPQTCAAYHRDLYVEGTIPPLAGTVLAAAQNAWVFGGMGSWNDMSFEGAIQTEYDRVSSSLFEALRNAITDAANCSLPAGDGTQKRKDCKPQRLQAAKTASRKDCKPQRLQAAKTESAEPHRPLERSIPGSLRK